MILSPGERALREAAALERAAIHAKPRGLDPIVREEIPAELLLAELERADGPSVVERTRPPRLEVVA